MRGGTYFLCRRKESKQRKRANTANASYCLRAPDGPVLYAVTHQSLPVANALNERLTRFNHP